MEIIILLGVIFGIIYFAFSSTFSPIPFFPTNRKDIPLIIDAMNLSNNQIVFDLGAGSGRVIFAAARKAHELGLDTKFVAIDINWREKLLNAKEKQTRKRGEIYLLASFQCGIEILAARYCRARRRSVIWPFFAGNEEFVEFFCCCLLFLLFSSFLVSRYLLQLLSV